MRFEEAKPVFRSFSIVVESVQELQWLEATLSGALAHFSYSDGELDFMHSLIAELKARLET